MHTARVSIRQGASPQESEGKQMSVLIVEDNLISAKVLEHTLGKGGYKTMTARDGKQGLECLESHPDVELVITDMVMPRIDGAQFIRKLRERNEWTDIPVLVGTSLKIGRA